MCSVAARESISNGQIAELLARFGEKSKPPMSKAFKRAARAALFWPKSASELVNTGQSLTGLQGIGPYLEKQILRWCEKPPPLSEIPEVRKSFLTLTEARKILSEDRS